MLKNKTKEQIKKQFKFMPTLFNHSSENDEIEHYEVNTDDPPNLTAIIDIPNYGELPVFNHSKTVLICLFQIVVSGGSPFLIYLLEKYNDQVQFIKLPPPPLSNPIEQEAVDYMSSILSDGEISYAGFSETPEHTIVFLKYVSLADIKSLPENYYWVTIHEIVNLKSVVTIPISLDVIHFFINNGQLLVLTNEDDVLYETPVVGYYIATHNDIYREKRLDNYEKCYYFHITMPAHSPKTMIRAVLFLKKTGLINDNFSDYDSIVYTKKNCISYYLIKAYAQHTILI